MENEVARHMHFLLEMLKFTLSLLFIFLSIQASAFDLNQLLSDKLYFHVKVEPSQRIIEVEPLQELYKLNNMSPLWTVHNRPNAAAQELRQILSHADDWGLSAHQYMTPELTRLFEGVNDRNAVTLEILLSDSYIRFARDLMNGQVLEPDLIDEDIKMPQKKFDAYTTLVEAAKRPEVMSLALEKLAPQNKKFQLLLSALKRLNALKAANAWGDLQDPGRILKPGARHSVLKEVKKRLHDLGYSVQVTSDVYDSDLKDAVLRYEELNGLSKTTTLSHSFFRSLAPGLDSRIDRIKANLEKFRWFPREWGNRYLMVNLAFQEMRVIENGQVVLSMKTVNGRPTRRTPTMRDEIRRVELSPTWTVPFSIALKDKLPLLQENPYALERMHIKVYDRNNQEIDPGSVDWKSVDKTNLYYKFVQQPGPQNALGLVKFPLTNPWFIYMHDTNEHYLMGRVERYRSSGCVRLEDAFKLAQYLLRDQPQWTLEEMKAPRNQPLAIPVTQPLPVYFLYQTVDVTDQGEIREVHDSYGQDQRLIELFKSRGSNEKF